MIKNIAPLILLTLLFTCCKQKPARTPAIAIKLHSNKIEARGHYTSPALNKYAAFIDSLSGADAATAQQAAKRYTLLFNRQNTTICDAGFIIFSTYYDKLNATLDDQHQKDTADYNKYLVNGDKHPMPAKMTAYINLLSENGFEFAQEEGATYVTQDRDFITRWFYRYVSPVMREYLTQVNMENKNIYMHDAGISITPDQLVERAIWWEDFYKLHSGFVLVNQAKSTADTYLALLLQGSDNTPVTEYNTKALTTFFKDAYTLLQKKYPTSDAGKLAIPYYQLLLNGKDATANSLLKAYVAKGFIKN
ncbi:hypothetical protein SAMN05216464_10711 [Mucilaginibacter pineti]|uniref:Uncharacterized protein n=1 Tax=Mucilaginibacter pineti TaxID=1391627 RepID=A0A1G7DLR7_9SPHI|nr:hypothetical protein [Mucilaginibacter pineti]SDE51755.1 hypothetical protein SAMN05216464_10711 [Mucilaginibacter pineti]